MKGLSFPTAQISALNLPAVPFPEVCFQTRFGELWSPNLLHSLRKGTKEIEAVTGSWLFLVKEPLGVHTAGEITQVPSTF